MHMLCSHMTLAHSSDPILCHHLTFSYLLRSSPPQLRRKMKMLVGLINSIPVLILVKLMTSTSTISLAAAYRLQLLPLFNRFGFYSCNTSLFVPTNNGFYTSKVCLQCSHSSGERDIVLGSDWISLCGVVLCDDGSGLVDPLHPAGEPLPPGHCWSRNEGEIVCSL